ncbi:MAG TPA: dihydroneopterin aldolase [Burkholderiales bacterium]|nr:dihydroneopterin aldolase [Burkholderiales bacterium]
MDVIFLRDLRVDAQVGIYKRERVVTQPISIDLDIGLPDRVAAKSGKVADTIDYAVVVQRLQDELKSRRFGLVEEMGEFIADMLLHEFGAPWVKISLAKLGILKDVRQVGLIIERSRLAQPRG